MKVDPSKVNLSEKDIEDWLFENPGSISIYGHTIEGWIGRQIHVPSGIIDLLGYHTFGENRIQLVVVEVNNVEFSQSAILQVCRYAHDIENGVYSIELDNGLSISDIATKVVIAKGIVTDQLLYEANSVNVSLISFSVNFEISTGGNWRFTLDRHQENIKAMKNIFETLVFEKLNELKPEVSPVFKDFIENISEESEGE